MIIAIEGMDGAGKTTICNHIERAFNFINIEKPTKYLFENKNGIIDYKEFYETLDKIYRSDEKTRSQFFGTGNLIAVTRYPNSNIVIDRHLASNYYWNGNKSLNKYYSELIKLCGKPDITIYLHATPKTRYLRLKKRNLNDLDLKDSTIFADGSEKNIEFLKRFNFEYRVIDTNNKSIKEVCREVDHILKEIIIKKEKRKKSLL